MGVRTAETMTTGSFMAFLSGKKLIAAECRAWWLRCGPSLARRMRLALGGRRAAVFPGAIAAFEVAYARQAHLLEGGGGQRRAPGGLAIEHQLLARTEHVLVIRAFRVDPEFEHAARCVDGTRDQTLALQLAHVAQIHENDIVAAVPGPRLGQRQRADFCTRFRKQLFIAFLKTHAVLLDRLVQRVSPNSSRPMSILR